MPLLDHFHPPTANLSPWSSFHGTWVTMPLGALNRLLLPRYRARGNYHLGRQMSRAERTLPDVWLHPLVTGDPLPVVPRALLGAGCVPVDLEATYTQVRALEAI